MKTKHKNLNYNTLFIQNKYETQREVVLLHKFPEEITKQIF